MEGVEKEVFKPIGDDGEKKDKLSILEEEIRKLRAEKDAERAELLAALDSLKTTKPQRQIDVRADYIHKKLSEDGTITTLDVWGTLSVSKPTALSDFKRFLKKNAGKGYILINHSGSTPFKIKKSSIQRELIYNLLLNAEAPFTTNTAQLCVNLNIPYVEKLQREIVHEDVKYVRDLLFMGDVDYNYVIRDDDRGRGILFIDKAKNLVRRH